MSVARNKLGHMTERWMAIPGYDYYEVSDHGRVRSLDRVGVSRWGTPRQMKGRVLKQIPQGRYLVVALYQAGQQPGNHLVHRLVLSAFVGPCPSGHEALHYDDDGNNNRLENLRWGTRSENAHDCLRNGNHWRGNATHCPNGHERTDENTYVAPSTGYRYCRICAKDWRATRTTRPHSRDRTHCPQGHPYDEANTIRAGGRRQCRTCGRDRAREYQRRKRAMKKLSSEATT